MHQPPDEFTIRPVHDRDDEALARILRTVMHEVGVDCEGSSFQDAEIGAISSAYSGKRAAYFVVERAGVVLGGGGIGLLQGGDPEMCELRKMYLLAEARGLGLGRCLLDACLEAARRAGYTCCYLETTHEQARARELYEKSGFARLDAPLGNTGHSACNAYYARDL